MIREILSSTSRAKVFIDCIFSDFSFLVVAALKQHETTSISDVSTPHMSSPDPFGLRQAGGIVNGNIQETTMAWKDLTEMEAIQLPILDAAKSMLMIDWCYFLCWDRKHGLNCRMQHIRVTEISLQGEYLR